MGSSEPLGTPDELDTQESDTIILDGPTDTRGAKPADPAPKPAEAREKKGKKGVLVDEEVLIFTSMTAAVREVATFIRDIVSVDVHPGLYDTVMTATHTVTQPRWWLLAISSTTRRKVMASFSWLRTPVCSGSTPS